MIILGGHSLMNVWDYILGALLVIASLLIIAVILLQEGRRKGISGVISGGADTFLSKGKAKAAEAILERWTKWIIVVFFVLVLVANILNFVLK